MVTMLVRGLIIRDMKRQRVDDGAGRDTADDDGGWTTQLKLLSPALQQAMNGREYCTEAQLTPKVMLDRLLAVKEIAMVEAADISVQTLSGGTFTVTMERSDNEVHVLKALIESKQGASRLKQDLYLIEQQEQEQKEEKEEQEEQKKEQKEQKEQDESSRAALRNDGRIEGRCLVLLCVRTETGEDKSESISNLLIRLIEQI